MTRLPCLSWLSNIPVHGSTSLTCLSVTDVWTNSLAAALICITRNLCAQVWSEHPLGTDDWSRMAGLQNNCLTYRPPKLLPTGAAPHHEATILLDASITCHHPGGL